MNTENTLNQKLYSIDVALVGEADAPKRWQLLSPNFNVWITIYAEPHWEVTVNKYHRDPKAPPFPAWDWQEAPTKANYRTIDSRGNREWWESEPYVMKGSWFRRISIDPVCGLNGRRQVGIHTNWKNSLEVRPPQAWFDRTADMVPGEYEALRLISCNEKWSIYLGGGCPVEGNQLVQVIDQKGHISDTDLADSFEWTDGVSTEFYSDVVAYRVVELVVEDSSETEVKAQAALENMLLSDNERLRTAGCDLAEAAARIVNTYDGVHRLSLALSAWYTAVANEGYRAEAPEPVTVSTKTPNQVSQGGRLRPMDEAPRDGTRIIVKERSEEGNWYRLCHWVKPYSIYSQCGAWMHKQDGNSISHITEQRALGWMPQPDDP